MPTYEIKAPDGRTFEITAPDGATQDQVLDFARKHYEGLTRQRSASDADMRRLADPTAGMSALELGLAGAGKSVADLGRGVGQLVGLVSRDDVKESRERDRALMNTTAGKVGNFAGNVFAYTPTALVPGANTVTGGAAIGALTGLLQPSTSTNETVTNVVTGGAAGAAVPALIKTAKVGKSLVEPFYEKGKEKIIGRALREAAGGHEDEVIRALQTNRSGVPGVQYTAAEAADNAGIAALHRASSSVTPHVTVEVSKREAANNAARLAALNNAAGSDGQRALLKEAREAAADALYAKAREAGINPAALSSQAQQNIAAFQARVPENILNEARELAKIYGVNMDNESVVQGLHWVKKAIDGKIGAAQRSGNKELARAYIGLKNDLLAGLDQISPLYQQARQTYSAMSKPITEMEVVDELLRRSKSALNDTLYPQSYARALSDKTAAAVTGLPNAKLDNVVSPSTLKLLNDIKTDLARQQFVSNAGRGAGSDTVQKLAYTNMLNQAGVPTVLRGFAPASVVGNVASKFAQTVYRDANEQLAERLALALLNPDESARLMMGAAINPKNVALANALSRAGLVALPAAAYSGSQ